MQETLLAALTSADKYEGRAKVKTWLVGILKFKVLDALRARARAPRTMSDLETERRAGDVEALFDEAGTWRQMPHEWSDPTHETRRRDFDRVLETCLEKLPGVPAQAFVLREVFELDPDEVCRLVSVTRNHLNVLLYRARMSLRRCLEVNWLAGEGAAS